MRSIEHPNGAWAALPRPEPGVISGILSVSATVRSDHSFSKYETNKHSTGGKGVSFLNGPYAVSDAVAVSPQNARSIARISTPNRITSVPSLGRSVSTPYRVAV